MLRITEPYKLASRTFKPEDTVITIGDVRIGGDEVIVMAGPCSAESEEQVDATAAAVKRAGAKILRGGAFKPRSSPYSFQGLGEEGLQMLRGARIAHDLKLVSEVMDISQIELIEKYADIFQVGARNMQNFTLLRELGRRRKPVLLKRGISATIEEWLLSAEYILAGGNTDVMLCERGIRTFESYTRNTLDISAIPVVKQLSHLPIIVDPSHGTGRRDKVAPMARAAVAAGADGLIIEVHCDPDHALSDGAQSMFPAQFDRLMAELRIIAPGDRPQHLPRAGGTARMEPVDPHGFDRIVVIGHGLIGGSIALAASERLPEVRVTALDRNDDITAAADADLVVLAAPIGEILKLLPPLAAIVRATTVVTDTGSTKTAIVEAAAGMRFIGGHPIAGAAVSGLAAARADLFAGRQWILTPTEACDRDRRRASRTLRPEPRRARATARPGGARSAVRVSQPPSAARRQCTHGRRRISRRRGGARDGGPRASRYHAPRHEPSRPLAGRGQHQRGVHVRSALDGLIARLTALRDDPSGDALSQTFGRAARWRERMVDGKW